MKLQLFGAGAMLMAMIGTAIAAQGPNSSTPSNDDDLFGGPAAPAPSNQSPGQGDSLFGGSEPAPVSAAQGLADKLTAKSVDTDTTFSPGRAGTACFQPNAADHWAIRCHVQFVDTARDGNDAGLDFLIYASDVSFAAEDAGMIADATRVQGRWHINEQPEVSITGPDAQKHEYKLDCRQALGNPNQLAVCMVQAAPRILVVSEVLPAQPSTESVSLNDTSSDTFQDIDHAIKLAIHGAIHVLKSLSQRQ